MKTLIRHLHLVAGESLRRGRLLSGMILAAAGLGGILGFIFPRAAMAGGGDPFPTVMIRVYNYSQASPRVLTRAEREAGRILDAAGLRTVWLQCPVGPSTVTPKGLCEKELEATDVRLRVLAAPTENGFQDTVFGFTVHPAFATVYYDYAMRHAKGDRIESETPIILGCVIAHELGHLLLGADGHSRAGIMQPRWEPDQVRQLMMGSLLFTAAQAKLMREQAQMRARPQTGTLKGDHREQLGHLGDLSWSQTTNAPTHPAVPEMQSLARMWVKLPIRVFWDYLVIVEGSTADVQKLNFLVDTGAYPSVIDQKIARRLGLAEQPGRVNLSNKSVETRLVVLPSLLLGPIRVESLPVLTEDLSFLQKALGHRVDGIVGLDVLRKSSFTINYKTKEMLFGPIEDVTFSAPFDTDVPVVTIRTEFDNRQLRLVVDSGGPDLMLFHSRMPDSTGFQELGTESVADVNGTFRRRKVQIREVFLGKETIGSQTAFVVDDRKDEGDNFDGVLGVRGPQFWKIAFDFEHRRFCWER